MKGFLAEQELACPALNLSETLMPVFQPSSTFLSETSPEKSLFSEKKKSLSRLRAQE